jgi:hypothetical protein
MPWAALDQIDESLPKRRVSRERANNLPEANSY